MTAGVGSAPNDPEKDKRKKMNGCIKMGKMNHVTETFFLFGKWGFFTSSKHVTIGLNINASTHAANIM